MAGKNRNQYIRYYEAGTAARVLEPEQPRQSKAPRQPQRKPRRIPVPFDPVARIGVTVAVMLVMCVFLGFAQLNHVNRQIQEAENAICILKSEQYALQKKYNAGIDLEDIRLTAEAMGLVPVDEVRHIAIELPEPEPVEEVSWWEELWRSIKGLFE